MLFHPKQTEPADNKNHPKKNPILDGCFKEMRFYIQTLGKIPNSMQISAKKPASSAVPLPPCPCPAKEGGDGGFPTSVLWNKNWRWSCLLPFIFLSFIEIFVSVVTSNHHLLLKTTHQKLRNVKHRFTAQLLWFSATVVDDLSDAMISGKNNCEIPIPSMYDINI